MNYIADRMGHIDASGIRKVFALAAQMTDPINLSIGQPDYDVDDAVKQSAIDAIVKMQSISIYNSFDGFQFLALFIKCIANANKSN